MELSRTGLNNVIRLFLVICYHDNSIEVVRRVGGRERLTVYSQGKQLYSLLNYRQLISSNERNLTVIWKGEMIMIKVLIFLEINQEYLHY